MFIYNQKDRMQCFNDECQALYTREIERIKSKYNGRTMSSNDQNQVDKCLRIINMARCLEDYKVFDIEGCWGDSKVRDFQLSNAGSVMQVMIKTVTEKLDLAYKMYTGYCKDYEVKGNLYAFDCKYSMNGSYYARPRDYSDEEKKHLHGVLLINRDGVSYIKLADVDSVLTPDNKFPYTGLYGNRNNDLVICLNKIFNNFNFGNERVIKPRAKKK